MVKIQVVKQTGPVRVPVFLNQQCNFIVTHIRWAGKLSVELWIWICWISYWLHKQLYLNLIACVKGIDLKQIGGLTGF